MQVVGPIRRETVSSREYLQILERQRSNIRRVDIVPARLGSTGFGRIRVEYKTPILKNARLASR